MKMDYIVSRIEESQDGAPVCLRYIFQFWQAGIEERFIEERFLEEWCEPAAYWSIEHLGIVVNEND